MRPTFRFALCLAAAAVVGGHAVASDMRDIQQAVSDDAMLSSAGVDPAKAELRKPCQATVVDTDDPAELFDCVYVQTSRDLNLFSLEDGYLMSELQLTLANMDGVALQYMGRYSQVQVFSGKRVCVIPTRSSRLCRERILARSPGRNHRCTFLHRAVHFRGHIKPMPMHQFGHVAVVFNIDDDSLAFLHAQQRSGRTAVIADRSNGLFG